VGGLKAKFFGRECQVWGRIEINNGMFTADAYAIFDLDCPMCKLLHLDTGTDPNQYRYVLMKAFILARMA
jgi:hypothetical protein